jgi:hypothetical protein
VGPRCIVVWRRRPDLRRPIPGGGHQFYTGVERDRGSDPVPTIANGMDVQSIVGVVMKQLLSRSADHGFGASLLTSDLDVAELNRLLAKLPSEPDEKLR